LRDTDIDDRFDAGALNAGYISVTPCQSNLLDLAAYGAVKGQSISQGEQK